MLVNELEEAWEVALAEASQRAQSAGRADIAGYLDLRRRNDLLRRTAIDWLNGTFTALAAEQIALTRAFRLNATRIIVFAEARPRW